MSAKILDGKVLAQKIKDNLKEEVAALLKQNRGKPSFKAIAIGNDAGTQSYISSQKKTAEYIGIDYELIALPEKTLEVDVLLKIKALNKNTHVHGVMVHQPMPKAIDYSRLINALDVEKDIEGMNVGNLGQLMMGNTAIIPCTPASVVEHLRSTGMDFKGKEAVIVGRSEIVGKPLLLLLLELNLTVTVCHSKTEDLEKHVGRADVLVASVGKPNIIKGNWIKKGAVVVDVGINRVGEKITGDVEFDSAKEKASFITPVPGGVGPLTSVMLMKNCVNTFKAQMSKG